MRIACFLVPLFPLAARLRAEPELMREAVAITEGNGSAAHVVAASKRARKTGIRPGMSLPQARAILPRLIARARDEVCERSAQEALLDVAESFSPRIEDAGEGIVYLDLEGLEGIWSTELKVLSTESHPTSTDTPHSVLSTQHSVLDEPRLAHSALRALERAALPAWIGIASSKLAARVAAELPDTPVIVPDGREREFLSPLPLHRLSPEMKIAATLESWGIGSIGAFAKLPEGEVATRLGETGRELHWAARGLDPSPIIPRQPPPIFEEGMDLEWPLVAIEPFLFVARAALERMTSRMEARGYSCRALELSMRLDPEGWDTRAVALPAPTRDVKTLLTLVKLDVEAKPPGAPVAGFRFLAHPDKPRTGQLSLFGPPELSPDKVMATVARIGAIVGPDRVGSPRVADTNVPDSFGVAPYDPPPPPRVRRPPRRGRGLLAVRVLRPPVPIDVQFEGDPPPPGAIPTKHLRILSIRLRDDAKGENGRPLRLGGPVRLASGPWTVEEGWWADVETDRDYWDVELSGSKAVRVYRVRGIGEWFIDAMYD